MPPGSLERYRARKRERKTETETEIQKKNHLCNGGHIQAFEQLAAREEAEGVLGRTHAHIVLQTEPLAEQPDFTC